MNNSVSKLIGVIFGIILMVIGLMMGTSFGPYGALGPALVVVGFYAVVYIWLFKWF